MQGFRALRGWFPVLSIPGPSTLGSPVAPYYSVVIREKRVKGYYSKT